MSQTTPAITRMDIADQINIFVFICSLYQIISHDTFYIFYRCHRDMDRFCPLRLLEKLPDAMASTFRTITNSAICLAIDTSISLKNLKPSFLYSTDGSRWP